MRIEAIHCPDNPSLRGFRLTFDHHNPYAAIWQTQCLLPSPLRATYIRNVGLDGMPVSELGHEEGRR